MAMDYLESFVETPFDYRHCCWFCAEPSQHYFTFPHAKHLVIACIHPTVTVPSCKECKDIAVKVKADDIYAVHAQVKTSLIKRYQKDLAIGLNWTKQSLEESQFEGGNFESFQKSAWFMYEVARDRVNFKSWPLVLNGLRITDNLADQRFTFDGVTYPTIGQAIRHYSQTYRIDSEFVKALITVLTEAQFARAISIARINLQATPQEKRAILQQLASV